jgi:hypothetical protein
MHLLNSSWGITAAKGGFQLRWQEEFCTAFWASHVSSPTANLELDDSIENVRKILFNRS